MSHIPNSAMPHAQADEDEEGGRTSLSQRAGRVAGKARENPKTSIAAGAALIAGAIAAVAVPFLRGRKKAEDTGPKTATTKSKPATKSGSASRSTAKSAGTGQAKTKKTGSGSRSAGSKSKSASASTGTTKAAPAKKPAATKSTGSKRTGSSARAKSQQSDGGASGSQS